MRSEKYQKRFYNYPETGYKEFQTTKYIAGKMEKLPCDVQLQAVSLG